MVIEIKKSTNPEYTDTIRVSGLAPFEYVIMSKEEYKDPLEGAGEYGPWAKYNVLVHEFTSLNPDTGDKVSATPNQVCGYFASGKSLMPKLTDIEIGQKFKITQVVIEGKSYKMYKVELINDDGTLEVVKGSKPTKAENVTTTQVEKPATKQTLDEKITILKTNGMPVDSIKEGLAKEFDTTVEFVEVRYNAL